MKSLIRKLFSTSTILRIKKLLTSIDDVIYPFFAKNVFLSSIYYCLFSTEFYREHKSVLQGRLKYKESLNHINLSSVLLRRNTHRLEKGLIMQPRRAIFAEEYIEETVACYNKCLNAPQLCSDELKWSYDVLNKYFEVVSHSDVIDKCRKQFLSLPHKTFSNSKNDIPYRHDERITSNISTEQLHNLFKQRRSVRWYQQKLVEKSLIEQAIDLASLAPSACNRQPFQFHVITDMNKASEVAAISMGTAGFSDNIPALIVVVGDLSAYPKERDRHLIYIDAGLAAMQLMLAFETLGLSSCPINWPDIESYEKKMSKKLKLEYNLRPVMLIAVGYAAPDGGIPFSQKKKSVLLIKDVS